MKKKKLKRLESLAKSKLTTLHITHVEKRKFSPSFLQFDGYTDLFITIESLINICVMASHVDSSNGTDDDGLDIRKTLELANKLLPFDEGEFLDEAYKLLKEKY